MPDLKIARTSPPGPTCRSTDCARMTLVLKHTPAIERVAAALLARTTLTESEVKEALV